MTKWKKIPGFDRYEVSEMGEVRTTRRSMTGGHEPQVLKPNISKKGYVKYNLCQNSKYKTLLGHRLVAEAFIPNPENKPCVDHINFDKSDNRAENLRWCTVTENNHATDRAGLRHAATNPNRAKKLTAEAVAEIRRLANEGVRTGLIAEEFDVAKSTIRLVVTGKSWGMPT